MIFTGKCTQAKREVFWTASKTAPTSAPVSEEGK